MSPWFDDDGRLRLGWRIVLAIIVAIWINRFASSVAGALTSSDRLADALYRPLAALLLLIAYSMLLLFADRVRRPLTAMGLGLQPGGGRQMLLGLTLGAGMIAVAVLCIAMLGDLHFFVHVNRHVIGLIAIELLILTTGALSEELVFRGYPFQRMIDAFRFVGEEATSLPETIVESVAVLAAALCFSVLFGAAHLWNPHSSPWAFVNTVAVGILLSFAYLRTRRLWLPWGIHFAWNATLGLGFGLPVSGLTQFAVVVRGQAKGPAWLTGGAYGIEASAVGTAVIVLGFVPLFLFTHPVAPTAGAARMGHPEQASGESSESPSGPGRIQY